MKEHRGPMGAAGDQVAAELGAPPLCAHCRSAYVDDEATEVVHGVANRHAFAIMPPCSYCLTCALDVLECRLDEAASSAQYYARLAAAAETEGDGLEAAREEIVTLIDQAPVAVATGGR
jgi:hypothetical protein